MAKRVKVSRSFLVRFFLVHVMRTVVKCAVFFLKSSEVPSKTPAFVREKRIFSHPLFPLASPSVLNVQARQVASQTSCPPVGFDCIQLLMHSNFPVVHCVIAT